MSQQKSIYMYIYIYIYVCIYQTAAGVERDDCHPPMHWNGTACVPIVPQSDEVQNFANEENVTTMRLNGNGNGNGNGLLNEVHNVANEQTTEDVEIAVCPPKSEKEEAQNVANEETSEDIELPPCPSITHSEWEHWDAKCVPNAGKNQCKPWQHWDGTKCVGEFGKNQCKPWQHWDGTKCVGEFGKNQCKPWQHWDGTKCVGEFGKNQCKPWQHWDGTKCVGEFGKNQCKPWQHWDGTKCVMAAEIVGCPPNLWWNGTACVRRCGPDKHWDGTKCAPDVERADCIASPWIGPFSAKNNEKVQNVANEVRKTVELRYGELNMYKAVEFKQQIVARNCYDLVGTNFEIKIQIKEEEYYLTEISVFKPLLGKEAEFKGFSERPPAHYNIIGGWSYIERANDEVQKICDQLISEVEKRYGFDVQFVRYFALQFQYQIVALNWTNFRIWIQIDDALVFIVIEATRGFDGTLTLTKVL